MVDTLVTTRMASAARGRWGWWDAAPGGLSKRESEAGLGPSGVHPVLAVHLNAISLTPTTPRPTPSAAGTLCLGNIRHPPCRVPIPRPESQPVGSKTCPEERLCHCVFITQDPTDLSRTLHVLGDSSGNGSSAFLHMCDRKHGFQKHLPQMQGVSPTRAQQLPLGEAEAVSPGQAGCGSARWL